MKGTETPFAATIGYLQNPTNPTNTNDIGTMSLNCGTLNLGTLAPTIHMGTATDNTTSIGSSVGTFLFTGNNLCLPLTFTTPTEGQLGGKTINTGACIFRLRRVRGVRTLAVIVRCYLL